MSVISNAPPLVNTSEDPSLEYLNQREIEVAVTPTENSTKSIVYEEVTQVITNVFQVNAPIGANGQLQFNQNGTYVGDAELQYDPNTDTLTTGTIVANSITITGNASSLKLNGGNNNDVLKTDGNGNLSWANVFPSVSGNTGKFLVTNGVSIDWSTSNYNSYATTTYVDSAIDNLLGTAPGILDTLEEIANVIGNTQNAEYSIVAQLANKANISNLAQVAFSGSYADLSNIPNISNVGSTGNYEDLINKPTIPASILDLGISDGSNGQVLTTYGNGKYHFTTVTSGSNANIGNINFDNNIIYSNTGVVINNSDLVNGQTAGMAIPVQGDGNTAALYNIYGNVTILTGNIGNSQPIQAWTFNPAGALFFPETPYVTSAILVNDNNQELSISTDRGNISIWPENSKWLFGADGRLTLPESGSINMNGVGGLGWDSSDGNNYNLVIQSDNSTRIQAGLPFMNWEFGSDGNLTLPQADMTASPAPTLSGIIFSDGTFQNTAATGGSATNEITNTIPEGPTYSVSVGTDGVVTMTTARGGLEFGALPELGGPTHFHVMRPASENGSGGTDLYFGDDYNYVLQRPAAYGNYPGYGVEIGANDNNGGAQHVWRFGTDGLTQFPVFESGSLFIQGGELGSAISGIGISAKDNVVITADILGDQKQWQFGTDGKLTLPSAVKSQSVAQVGQIITCMGLLNVPSQYKLFNSVTFTGGVYSDIQVGWAVSNGEGWTATVTSIDDPAPGFITIDAQWDAVDDKLVSFTSPDYQAATSEDLILTSDNSSLTLSANGNLTLPNSGGVIKSTASSTIINGAYKSFTISTGAYGPGPGYSGNGLWVAITPETEQIQAGWTCTFSDSATVFTVTSVGYSSGNFSINFDGQTDNVVFPMVANSPTSSIKLQPVEGGSTWTFSGDGTTIFPGDLIGSGASPAPSINGFSSATFSGNVSVGNISATNLGNISSINKDGNASNILYGNGVFAAAPTGGTVSTTLDNSSAGDMDVMIYDGNFKYTSSVTIDASSGILKANLFSGNGSSLTSLAAANVTGTVANATYATTAGTANSVAGANVSGTVSAATTAGTVTTAAQPNITSVGILTSLAVTGTTVTGVNSILAGPTFTPLANTMAGFVSNVNSYTQLTIQNKNTGADATADYVLTADNGSDTVNYLDLGIINSGYDANTPTNSLGNIVFAADSYLYAQGNTGNSSQSGGNLAIGTTVPGKNVKIFAGGVNNSSIIANISNTGIAVNGNVTATNFSGNISITGNVTGTSPNVTLVAGSYSYTFDNTGILTLPSTSIGSGNEGGEIDFTKAPNSTLSGNSVVIDQYLDRIRFFESGGNVRGAYIDLSQAATGVGTLLNNRASGVVNAGVDVILGNLKARIPTSGNRSLQVSTVSGTYSVVGSSTYSQAGVVSGVTIQSTSPRTINTTPAYLNPNYNFSTDGSTDTWTIYDATNVMAWRITMILGASFLNNLISIERLV